MMTGPQPRVLADRLVLIVEDQYLIADDMRLMVERLGGRVLGPVSRVPTAIAALAGERPDLALLDVNLDGEDVYAVADALRSAAVPFLFTTGYDPWTIDPRFSAAPHLEKPIAMPALMSALRDLDLA